jgi:sugar/nucleoside kinase (ribokinase family)
MLLQPTYLNLILSSRVISTVEERSQVLASLTDAGFAPKISPGGSLCNTLVTVSRLSRAAEHHVSVALGGSSSSDALGSFFVSSLAEAGVGRFDTAAAAAHDMDAPPRGTTGLVFVLPSSDGQRSFLSFFEEETMIASSQLLNAISKSRIVVVEGYLWCMPGAARAIQAIVDEAKKSGTQIVLTAGDPGVVARYREDIWQVLNSPSGREMILFANREEACELLGQGRCCDAMKAAGDLGSLCSIAIVTDGSNGSFVSCMGRVEAIPPSPVNSDLLDTCGAGDAYAGAFLYALMSGHLCCEAGQFASTVAAQVVSRHGSQLTQEEATQLISNLPTNSLSSLDWISALEANLLGH